MFQFVFHPMNQLIIALFPTRKHYFTPHCTQHKYFSTRQQVTVNRTHHCTLLKLRGVQPVTYSSSSNRSLWLLLTADWSITDPPSTSKFQHKFCVSVLKKEVSRALQHLTTIAHFSLKKGNARVQFKSIWQERASLCFFLVCFFYRNLLMFLIDFFRFFIPRVYRIVVPLRFLQQL